MTLRISKWLFLLLVVSLPLVRPFNVRLFGLLVPSTDFIFLLAFGFWLIAALRGETKLRYGKLYFFLAFYGFALTVSTVFSSRPEQSIYKLPGAFYLISLCVLTFNLAQSAEFFKRITQAWLFGTGLTILASLAGFVLFYAGYKTEANNYFLSHFGSLPAGNYPRIHALFANANMMCDFLNVSVMLAVLAARIGWVGKIWARILYLGIGFAAFFTLSPGLGGLFLSLGVWLWANLRSAGRKTFAVSACFLGIILALAFFAAALVSPDTPNTNQDFELPFVEKKFEPSSRVLIWQSSLETVRKFPFLGRGTGTDVASVEYTTLSGDSQFLTDAHNVWLSVFGQLGFFGFVAFASLCAFLLSRCKFLLADNAEKSLVRLALSCAFLGAFWYQSWQGSFEDARHLWILFGLLANAGENDFELKT